MSILENITPDFIFSKQKLLANANLVVIDPSLPDETIQTIIDVCKGVTPLYIDPISDNFALKVRPYVKDFELIKPNRSELASLTGMDISSRSAIEKAGRSLLDQGLKKLVVSMSEDGILYMDKEKTICRRFKAEKRMVNASGAGDALMAAILYGETYGLSIEETIDYALAAGIAAVRSPVTINENMSIGLLDEIIKENIKK